MARTILPQKSSEVMTAWVFLIWLTFNVVVWDIIFGSVKTDLRYWLIQLLGMSGMLAIVTADLLGRKIARAGLAIGVPFICYSSLAFYYINVDYFMSYIFFFMIIPWAYSMKWYEYVGMAVLCLLFFGFTFLQIPAERLVISPDMMAVTMVTSVVSTGVASIVMFLVLWSRQRNSQELSERLELLGMQSSFLSHEIRGSLQRLEGQGNEEASALRRSVESFEILLINPAEVQSRFRVFSAELIKEQIEQAFSRYLRPGTHLRFFGESSQLFGDPLMLERAVRNLVRNALEAMSSADVSGEVRINISKTSIVVENPGTNIPRTHLKRIFDPFYTTKQGVNRGVGLHLVTAIMKLHSGAVRCKKHDGPVVFELSWLDKN